PDGYLAQLARMYAIESGQPEISRVKRKGLARFYGIDGGRGSEYFRVHERDDRAHAEEARRLIEDAMTPADEDAVVEAAASAFRANWRLLDGVCWTAGPARGRFPRPGDRAIGIALGILLGIAIVLLFLFLGSRDTIDEPSLSGGANHTVTHPAQNTQRQ